MVFIAYVIALSKRECTDMIHVWILNRKLGILPRLVVMTGSAVAGRYAGFWIWAPSWSRIFRLIDGGAQLHRLPALG